MAEVSDGVASATITIGAGARVRDLPMREAIHVCQIHGESPSTSNSIKAIEIADQVRYVKNWLRARAGHVGNYREIAIDPATLTGSPIGSAIESVRRWGVDHYFKRPNRRRSRVNIEWFDARHGVILSQGGRQIAGIGLGGAKLLFADGEVEVAATSAIAASVFGLIDGSSAYSEW